MEKKTNFMRSAMLLSAAGLIVKLIGSVYRIVLNRLVGAEGMGTYQLAYPIYSILLAVSTAGIPTAISKMMAERLSDGRKGESYRVFVSSMKLLTVIGLVFSALLLLGADWYSRVILGVPEAALCIRAIAPAIFFVSLSSGFRGFFQGIQDMSPSAASQILEQIFRVLTIFGLVWLLLPLGVDYAAAGASFGPVIGGLSSVILLSAVFLKRKTIWTAMFRDEGPTGSRPVATDGEIMKKLLLFALPITLGSLAIPAMNAVDSVLCMNRLMGHTGMTLTHAKELYGYLSSYASTLLNLPPVITTALAASLVPAISSAFAAGEEDKARRDISTGVKITLMIGLPAAVGLGLFATPIMELLYNDAAAGPVLLASAASVIFLTLNQTCAGVLQGVGRVMPPVYNIFIGLVVKTVLTYVLVGFESIGILGAAWASIAGFATASLLNLRAVVRFTGTKLSVKTCLVKPLTNTLIMGLGSGILFRFAKPVLGSNVSLLLAICVAVGIYGVLTLMLRTLSRQEMLLFPGVNESRLSLLEKFHLYRGYEHE